VDNSKRIKDAYEFLGELDDLKVFEVECRQTVIFHVVAESKKEAKEAVAKAKIVFNEPLDILVSKLPQKTFPDSGVFDGKLIHIEEYTSQRVWELVRQAVGGNLNCQACGSESWVKDINLSSKPPKYGYMPVIGCPDCGVRIDWKRLIKEKEAIPLYREGKDEADE
jgi:hypothetical protein